VRSLCAADTGKEKEEIAPQRPGAPKRSRSVNPLLVTEKFSGNLEIASTATPLPAALPLFAIGRGGLGLLGWRSKRKAHRQI